jgi:hypothetical protein
MNVSKNEIAIYGGPCRRHRRDALVQRRRGGQHLGHQPQPQRRAGGSVRTLEHWFTMSKQSGSGRQRLARTRETGQEVRRGGRLDGETGQEVRRGDGDGERVVANTSAL